MNVLTGSVCAVMLAVGWLMLLWFAVMVLLGRDIRRQIRMAGAVPPRVRWADVWLTAVYHVVTVLFTVGFFVHDVRAGYADNQRMLVAVIGVTVLFAVLSNDRLHHVLMAHIACLDGLKNQPGDAGRVIEEVETVIIEED